MDTRALTADDHARPRPVNAVWEITLRCDLACGHCGSRAGRARVGELSGDELMAVADALIRLQTRQVTLIGGEAYLRPEVFDLIRHIADHGVRVAMQTGGRGVTASLARRLAAAGLSAMGVSIDGPAEVHDVQRGARGSHAAALAALGHAADAGMVTSSAMQLNRLTAPHLRDHYASLRQAGARTWRVQLTVPMGRAADHPEWILEPWRVVYAIDELAAIQLDEVRRVRAEGRPARAAMHVSAASNLGYFGPHEEVLRSVPGHASTYYQGCGAGRFVIGIEADGTVKACPSLPTSAYTAGNVRTMALEDLWHDAEAMRFTRDRTVDELWGFCRTCDYAEVCRGGCSFTAHCTLGKRGNNPFCYHRVTTLAARGVRERLEHVAPAPGVPFDRGLFRLVEEPAE